MASARWSRVSGVPIRAVRQVLAKPSALREKTIAMPRPTRSMR
jgi:hypothetical protein